MGALHQSFLLYKAMLLADGEELIVVGEGDRESESLGEEEEAHIDDSQIIIINDDAAAGKPKVSEMSQPEFVARFYDALLHERTITAIFDLLIND